MGKNALQTGLSPPQMTLLTGVWMVSGEGWWLGGDYPLPGQAPAQELPAILSSPVSPPNTGGLALLAGDTTPSPARRSDLGIACRTRQDETGDSGSLSSSPEGDYVFPGDLPQSLSQYLEQEIDIEVSVALARGGRGDVYGVCVTIVANIETIYKSLLASNKYDSLFIDKLQLYLLDHQLFSCSVCIPSTL